MGRNLHLVDRNSIKYSIESSTRVGTTTFSAGDDVILDLTSTGAVVTPTAEFILEEPTDITVSAGDNNNYFDYVLIRKIGNIVKLNSAGMATFSEKFCSVIETEGVMAYKAAIEGESIVLTLLEGDIAEDYGVILYGGEALAGTTVELGVAAEQAEPEWDGNDLQATTTRQYPLVDMNYYRSEFTFWALGNSNEFLQYTGSEFKYNRAFFLRETASAAPMRIVFAGETNAISSIEAGAAPRNGKQMKDGNIEIISNGVTYNALGKRVKKTGKK